MTVGRGIAVTWGGRRRFGSTGRGSLWALAAFAVVAIGWPTPKAYAFPVFARAYDVPCSSCHSFITRRHQFGDVFRKAGYHWPSMAENLSDEVEATELRGTAAIAGFLPSTVPLALEGQLAVSHSTDPEVDNALAAGSPNLTLLMATALGDHASIFGTWTGTGPPDELYAHFARIGGLSELNLIVGQFEQTTTLFKSNDDLITGFQLGSSVISGHKVSQSRFGVEANGVLSFLGDRTFWAAGVVQNDDFSSHWDGYYHLEHKIGGMSLLGEEPEIDLMADESFWEAVHATISTWGYFGTVRDIAGSDTADVQRFGVDLRLFVHGLTLYSGVMLGIDRDLANSRDVTSLTWFAELGYPITSWLEVLYAFQFQDSTDLETERQRHDIGVVALLIENIRARIRFSFTDDDIRNDTLEAQLLMAF